MVRGWLVGDKEGIGPRLVGRRQGGDWSEAGWEETRRGLVRGWLVGDKEGIGPRLVGRRQGGDWSEAGW